MRVVLLRASFVLSVIALAVWTHLPVLRSSATARDLGVIAALAPEALPEAARSALPPAPARLAAASLRALLSAPDLLGDPFGMGNAHVAQLVLVLLAALGTALVARHALEPWVGAEGAAWCGRATALLAPLHPLAGASIGSLEAHGLLLASAAGAFACALFLRARRVEAPLRLGLAFLLLAVSAAAGRAAVVFALLFVLVEWASTRRHRPLAARVKSTLVTCVSAALVVGLAWLAAGEREAWELGDGPLGELALGAFATGFEKLGVLLLPGASSGAAAARLLVLGVLLLAVVHPAFLAARSAPRLWGWIALGAGLPLAAALLLHPRVRVPPGALASAHVLFPAGLALAFAVAAGATALVGTRRIVLPLLCALGWSLHGRGVLADWPAGAERFAELGTTVRAALAEHGPADALWIVDPPHADDPACALPRSLDWILHPGLGRAATGPDHGDAARTRLRALDAPTLALALRDPGFAEPRARGLVLALPAGFSGASAAARFALRVAPVGEPPTERVWRGEGRSPALECEPSSIAAVRALALAQTSTAEAPRLAWRARDERFDLGQATGVWLATDEGLQAYFDLASDPRFLLGRRIARVSFEGELARVRSAELVAALPALGRTAPEVRGDDWRFEAPADPLPRLVRGEGAWSLALFDPDGLASARFPVEADGPDGLRARGAAAFERAVRRRGGRALHWWLEYRVGDVTLAHLGGRR